MSKTVFISYSHIDSEKVKELISVLENAGVQFFLDIKDINWGTIINHEVQRGLANSSALIVVLSPASLKSQWVPYEIGYANALGIKILPFLLHPSLDLPPYMKNLNSFNKLSDVHNYFTEYGIPLSPIERDLLKKDGKYEWQWAGQNWHGFVYFKERDNGEIGVQLDIHKISKTQEVEKIQSIRKEPIVIKNSEENIGTLCISGDELILKNLVVDKNEFETIDAGDNYSIEGFKPKSSSVYILSAKLKRIPAFAGRILYKNKETLNESEGDMIIVKYKSTVDI